MVERIRTLLETRLLTPTQFADLIGVARPIVSHILSGRNKPSLEVVQRILAALPELSMPWLLNGTGAMYYTAPAALPPVSTEEESPKLAPIPTTSITEQVVVPAVPLAARVAQVNTSSQANNSLVIRNQSIYATPKRFRPKTIEAVARPVVPIASPPVPGVEVAPELLESPEVAESAAPRSTLAAHSVDAPPQATFGPVANQSEPNASLATALFAGAEKPIRRIVIFYRDGSFADYQPE